MKDIKDNLTYRSLKAKVNPPNYFIDIKKFEVYFSLICACILSIVLLFIVIYSDSNEITDIIEISRSVLLSATFGLLGLLGFIISGLAIISGTIGNKITTKIIQENKYKSLLSILFSFVYIGRLIGILIVVLITAYYLTSVPMSFNTYLFIGFVFILSYSLFFSVFFAVSLLITCINIFQLSYIYSQEIDYESSKETNLLFNDARIDTLTEIFIKKHGLTKEEFTQELLKNIDEDCTEEYKKKVIELAKEYYHFD